MIADIESVGMVGWGHARPGDCARAFADEFKANGGEVLDTLPRPMTIKMSQVQKFTAGLTAMRSRSRRNVTLRKRRSTSSIPGLRLLLTCNGERIGRSIMANFVLVHGAGSGRSKPTTMSGGVSSPLWPL